MIGMCTAVVEPSKGAPPPAMIIGVPSGSAPTATANTLPAWPVSGWARTA